jgi:predicted DsbA family dithiol-disulfide isomerase
VEAGAGAVEVERAEREVLRLGVQGVPLFIADRRYALSGAQPEGHLRELLAASRAAPHAA